MTDQTPAGPLVTHTISTTYATRDRDRAHTLLGTLAGCLAGEATDDLYCVEVRTEIETSEDTPGTYGQTFATEIAGEIDRLQRERMQAIEDEYARQPAADGLDDQDRPVTRAELYIERAGDRAIWAHRDGIWWYADPDIDDSGTAGWWQQRTGPLPASLRRLPGWVEIPQPAGDTATSEEQTSA